MAKKSGVCISVSVTINRNADDDQFDEIVDRLLRHDKARVSVNPIKPFKRISLERES